MEYELFSVCVCYLLFSRFYRYIYGLCTISEPVSYTSVVTDSQSLTREGWRATGVIWSCLIAFFFYIPYRMVKSCCMHLPSSWFHAAEINNQLPFADCVQLPVVEVFVCCSCAVIPGLMYCTHCQFNQLTTMIKILKISLHHNNTVCWLNITSTSCCSNNLFVLPQNLVCHTHSTWICFTNKNVIYKVEIITTVYHLIQ